MSSSRPRVVLVAHFNLELSSDPLGLWPNALATLRARLHEQRSGPLATAQPLHHARSH